VKARKAAVAGAVVIAAVAVLGYAQQPGFTRKLLQDQNLSVPERHAVQALAEFVPGGAAGRHTHPGEELGYVVEGTLLLEVDGQPARTLNAGDAFFVEAGKVHDGKNIGSSPARVLATYIVEKGKPVASPAK
jgi:quercetin dioxygenase-like cupin family protein